MINATLSQESQPGTRGINAFSGKIILRREDARDGTIQIPGWIKEDVFSNFEL
jgi:hypothetical protein